MARPLALVTGASRGIGLALAHEFARHGHDLVVSAEDAAISDAARELHGHDVEVHVVQADLATEDGVRTLHAALPRPLAAAALNAGVGQGRAFLDAPVADQLRVVDLDVRGVVHLAHLLLTDMTARDHGKLLITSSIASTMPGPGQPVYNAAKSFVQSLAEALADELRDTGVTVTSLMPGPTDTDFFRRAGLDGTLLARSAVDDPATVAAQGYAAMMKGRTAVVGGSPWVKAQAAVNGVLPDQVKAAAHRVFTSVLPRS
ncbi:SDR family NAD(P)-dependent oxidoreductase [Actinomycetospora straminea]|uniref:SDR family NAD(P)-dependent oxidoreductase n=1 Tax=Actinomycetospora straminea TaxID=663607 RepID=A0ABP9DUY1_9PSEU|nr:SDR family NAD(P)-dependent oxidoreductase [Actinomycetospora straminea]MDD7932415.1 SDR family NAD(P)-dependent oxidoreductase [Actinomycetospora straminea]